MTHHCELLKLQPQPALSIRARTSVTELPGTLGGAFKTVFDTITENGELPFGAPFVVYYNMDMDDLDIEAGYPVARPLPAKDFVKASEIPAGRYGSTTFTGPYQELSGAYQALTQWMQVNKYEPTGIVYEMYLNDPGAVLPQDLQTQILFPLK
jgi:effector-binding domain-containing protein